MRDKRGKVIGVMGITRRDEDRMRQHDVREVTTVMQCARQHGHEVVATADFARAARGLSPYEPLLRTRIQSAAEALGKTSAPIIQIVLGHAFCDQSAFTQQFRRRTGVTPKEFRMRHQLGGAAIFNGVPGHRGSRFGSATINASSTASTWWSLSGFFNRWR